MFVLLPLLFLYEVVEPVEPLVPQLLESGDPVVDRFETRGVDAVEPLLPVLADMHEPYFAQDAQMLRGGWLRDAQRAGQLVDRPLAPLEEDEDPPPVRFGDGVERVGCGRGSRHAPEYMPISAYVKSGRPRDQAPWNSSWTARTALSRSVSWTTSE